MQTARALLRRIARAVAADRRLRELGRYLGFRSENPDRGIDNNTRSQHRPTPPNWHDTAVVENRYQDPAERTGRGRANVREERLPACRWVRARDPPGRDLGMVRGEGARDGTPADPPARLSPPGWSPRSPRRVFAISRIRPMLRVRISVHLAKASPRTSADGPSTRLNSHGPLSVFDGSLLAVTTAAPVIGSGIQDASGSPCQ